MDSGIPPTGKIPELERLRSGRAAIERAALRPDGKPLTLADPVTWMPTYTEAMQKPLERLDLLNIFDLITHFPRGYVSQRGLNALVHGETQQVVGQIVSAFNKTTARRRMQLTEVMIEDGGSQLKLVFFRQPWLIKSLKPGKWLQATGSVEFSRDQFSMVAQRFQIFDERPADIGSSDTIGKTLLPEYPLADGLDQETLGGFIQRALNTCGEQYPIVVPDALVSELKLMPIAEAIRTIHAPKDMASQAAAALSLKFREFYLLSLGLAAKHAAAMAKGDDELRMSVDDAMKKRCAERFPFTFTAAQQRAVDEIIADVTSPGRMNRLLQGDVGSGKTAVALYAMLLAVENGFQGAILAPTEILARQHFRSISQYLEGSGYTCKLLIGGMNKAERSDLLMDLAMGKLNIVIGTHALLQPDVAFDKLGIYVIDEQHKFGVRQRAELMNKGNKPHRLAMSATPIPRTLSLTLYGDLDLTVIDELPPGRLETQTTWIKEDQRPETLDAIHAKLRDGELAYFILPLVETNPKLELTSAKALHRELSRYLKDVGVEMVHGQMSAVEKDTAMGRFASGEVRALVATVVVEVGVDVPQANIMVIEHAERFGLSQLHQLRGRVGRGGGQGELYLFADPSREESIERLKVFCETTDGFKIAEADLRIRGFGDFLGTRQTGMPKLRIGDPLEDVKVLARARTEAFARLEDTDREMLANALKLAYGSAFKIVDA